MIKKLHRRLTIMITAFTAIVLGAALLASWHITAAQQKSNAAAMLGSGFQALRERLESDRAITDAWLAGQETANRCLIFIEDNGAPLSFHGAWQPKTDRAQLLLAAKELLRQNGWGLTSSAEASFTLTGAQGEGYSGIAAQLYPGGGATAVLAVVLQDSAALAGRLRTLTLQYLLLFLCGVALLYCVAWQLSGRALRPTIESLRQQNEFVAAASHELRSPLAVIKASLAEVRTEGALNEKQAAFLQPSEREIDRMARLTEDLLLLAGSDSAALTLRPEQLDADTLCIELYEKFCTISRQSGHELTLKLPDAPLPGIYADRQRLEQLMACLITNAIDYTPAGTPIELEAVPGKNSLSLRVIDHGGGIAQADRQQVFSRFYRADKSRTDKAHFGLGLSIAKEIAALHRASLTLTDTAPTGCTFTLTLPLK